METKQIYYFGGSFGCFHKISCVVYNELCFPAFLVVYVWEGA